MNVILLAAGRGRRFGRRTARLPKCLIGLGNGQTLLSRYLDSFRALGLDRVTLVVGHQKRLVRAECAKKGRGLRITFVDNPRYRLGSIVSLACAARTMKEDCLIMDADVFFETPMLAGLLRSRGSAFLIDPRSKSSGEEMMLMARGARPVHIAKSIDPSLRVLGEATGFFKVSKADAPVLAGILRRMLRSGKTGGEYEEAYCELMRKRKVGFSKVRGFWTEMDFEEDLARIRRRLSRKRAA